MTNFNVTPDDGIVGTNKELLYVSHILSTLKDAQSSFNDMNINKFLLYCAYLENAILNDATRDEVIKERESEKVRLTKEGVDKKMIQFYEGFVVIKYVMKYLNDVMELEHFDIVGVVGQRETDETQEYDLFEEN